MATNGATHFRDTFVLLMASKPMHSTFARSQAEHAGSLPSHFCFRERQRVHDEMARATLYWVWSGTDAAAEGEPRETELLLRTGGAGCEKDGGRFEEVG